MPKMADAHALASGRLNGVRRYLRANSRDRGMARAAFAPHSADLAQRRWRGEGTHDDPARMAISAVRRKLRQQRDAGSRCDHLTQGFETRRSKILLLMHANLAAHGKRLVPQAMAV